jgi:hypothetical protein
MPYQVKIIQRIKEIMGKNFILTDDMSFTYSWEKGYEKATVTREKGKGGGSQYSGAYHPDGICKSSRGSGGGICQYCGTTLRYADDSGGLIK